MLAAEAPNLGRTLKENNMSSNHNLAIRWSDEMSSVRRLKRAGSVPIHAFPHHFRCPGGVVAIVSRNNEIRLVFRATAIIGPQRVTLANGKSTLDGYVIKPDKRNDAATHTIDTSAH